MPDQIDPTIKALAQAIGAAETGPNATPTAYTQKGASGEFGRYQFMPNTYKNYAQKYLGDANAVPTIENQNKIVYSFVKEKKAAGFNPSQISSMWNAGEGKPNAYKENYRGTNSQGVAYDTPAYAQKVSKYYEQYKGQGLGAVPGQVDAAMKPANNSFLTDASNTIGDAVGGVGDAVSRTLGGEINPLSGLIQGAGAAASGLGNLTNNVLEHTPIVGGVVKGAEDLIGKGVGALANTGVGQDVIQKYQEFAQAHPELAGDIGGAFNIATALPVLKGFGLAKDAIKGGISGVLHGGEDAVLNAVSPKLSAKEAAKAVASRGTVQKGLLRETQIAPDPYMQKVAASVKGAVPKFDAGDLTKSISQSQAVVKSMATKLKQAVITGGADRIYPKRQLISILRKLEKPDLIASDNTLNNVYDRLIKRVEGLADKNGGKVSNLLDLRQEFDGLVKRQYPNLYSSETMTPMRQAVRDIRDAITNFTADNLPEGTGLKESLLTQHHILTAIENMAEKATSGPQKVIGSNALTRLAGRHPIIKGLVKSGTKAAVEGSGIGAVMRMTQ